MAPVVEGGVPEEEECFAALCSKPVSSRTLGGRGMTSGLELLPEA